MASATKFSWLAAGALGVVAVRDESFEQRVEYMADGFSSDDRAKLHPLLEGVDYDEVGESNARYEVHLASRTAQR